MDAPSAPIGTCFACDTWRLGVTPDRATLIGFCIGLAAAKGIGVTTCPGHKKEADELLAGANRILDGMVVQ